MKVNVGSHWLSAQDYITLTSLDMTMRGGMLT